MKIAFILPAYYPYNKGTPAGVMERCRTLSEFGHQTVVICYHRFERRKPWAKVYRILKNPLYRQGRGPAYSRIPLDLLLFGKAIQACRKEKPDLVHAVTQEGALIALLIRKLLKIPFVFEIAAFTREELLVSGFAEEHNLVAKIAGFFDRYLPQKANHNTTVSWKIFSHLRPKLEKKISFIPDTVDLGFFQKTEALKEKNRIIIGYQGNLASIQNLDLIWKIAPHLISENPQIRFKIGSSENCAEIRKQIRTKGLSDYIKMEKVKFPEVPRFINSCDIMIIPRQISWGTPLKLLNFLACGKPVVAFRQSVENLTPEDIAYKVKSEQEFQKAILELVHDPKLRAAYAQKAYAFAQANFSRSKQHHNLQTVYTKVLRTKKR